MKNRVRMRNRFQPGENAWYVNDGKIVCIQILSVIIDPVSGRIDYTFLTGDTPPTSVLYVKTINQTKLHKFFGLARRELEEEKK